MKKSQAFSHPFTLLIILLMLGAVVLFGYSTILKLKERHCQAELLSFKDDLKITIEEVSRREGALVEKTFLFGCYLDKIYFIDREHEIENTSVNENPVINESINSGVKDNMFITKKGEVIDSSYIGDIALIPPYYGCFRPSGGKMEMLLYGINGRVVLGHKLERYSCGPTLVREVTAEKVNDTVEEIYTKLGDTDFLDEDGDGYVNRDDMNKILDKYERTKDYVDITREFKTTNDKTQVIIRINPKPGITLDEFDYIEEITKECMMVVFGYDTFIPGDVTGDYDEVIPDPLIMWHLGNTDMTNEEKIQYTINDPDFEELCRELLSGMGWSENVSSTMGP